ILAYRPPPLAHYQIHGGDALRREHGWTLRQFTHRARDELSRHVCGRRVQAHRQRGEAPRVQRLVRPYRRGFDDRPHRNGSPERRYEKSNLQGRQVRTLKMKTIYFVRHGESEGNASFRYQASETPLTERGREQARLMAERCTKFPIDIIVSSTMERAQETAAIIAERTGLVVEPSDFFRERRLPRELTDRLRSEVEAHKIERAWQKSLANEGPRVTDGENFDDIRVRTGKGLEYLISRSEQNILVSTHESFLRSLVARALFCENITGQEMKIFMRALRMENTGSTVLPHNADDPSLPWTLWIWNDHAHLG